MASTVVPDTDAQSPARVLADVVGALGGEPRAGQQEMVSEVTQVIEDGGTILVQAGTGTGKSLGYLVPAALGAAHTRRPVVISTSTIALQRQLIGRDIPLVTEALRDRGTQLSAATLKGWNNYLCLNKVAGGYPEEDATLFSLDVAENSGSADPAGRLGREVLRLREWSQETETGDHDDVTPSVSDRAWRQVSVSSAECVGSTCAFYEECFARLARERAMEADLVVTNHAMLGIAAAGNDGLIPEHSTLIVDEAHDLVDRVTSATTQELSVSAVTTAAKRARRQGASQVARLDEAAQALAEQLVPLTSERFTDGLPEGVVAAVELVRDAARGALTALKDTDTQSATHKVAKASLTDLFDISERMLAAADGDVLWSGRGPNDTAATLHAAALDVSAAIRERLLRPRSAVLCSATLFLGGRFEPFARTVGLWDEPTDLPWPSTAQARAGEATAGEDQSAAVPASHRWRGVKVATPFDYRRQGILYVARSLPPPSPQGFTESHLSAMAELVRAADGRTLGLFTSRRAAIEAAAAVSARVDTPILSQDEGHLAELVARFKDEEQTSLFGTMGLWQGIDVPGDSCRLVIIDRIPFARPDDPIASARIDRVKAAGGNGFQQISVPTAALRLAQGVGRLIRSGDDRGVVAVLDPRAVTKSYGTFLLRSLPEFWQTQDFGTAIAALGRLSAP